ncbi:putative acetamidase formamidase protein [Phaeoacremonium minimum UCRPA7]|uniref:Putative acetamidase formamidase protein n=1 Tax=Phaeoacremonium minimum (strain UCR-PA7) TaxID=1286976 RepID=R8BHV1_PHAM7|nr:putative acetamidase formamidase protein [Phaeoacremonium minimum UCRPA7]EON98908.1 putative acetamidase formamidase protein [Phaeoacremonium minimum UCRPA7]
MTVPSGTEISFDLKCGGNNQIRPDNEATALSTFDFTLADPAFGPVYVDGAEPGDVLKIDILDLTPADYGWSAILSGFGLLADEFPEQHVKIWDLSESALLTTASGLRRAVFKPGISVPVRPFLGVIGIAPAEPGEFSTIPPYAASGGNMDTRYLGIGTTLYMPIQVAGALFSCGDGHAAQGDGEVCGTAIETPMKARLRLTVEKKADRPKGWVMSSPHYVTGPRVGEAEEDQGTYAALGIHADPREAARMALRGLIDWLEVEKGLTRPEGYMLASVSASLKMTEVVDMPNYAVACSIPLSTFVE